MSSFETRRAEPSAPAPSPPPASEGVAAYLEWDHRRLDDLFTATMQQVARGSWATARSLFTSFRAGLRRHIEVEEGVLFPAFEAHTGLSDGGPTAVMRAEHREILAVMAFIGEALESERKSLVDSGAAGLLEVLGGHNRKEELILYPACDGVMDEEARADVVARMREA